MKKTNFKVYWTDVEGIPNSQDFGDVMTDALNFMQELRKDPEVSFVSLSSAIAECVSLDGVSPAPADYDWRKRRGYETPGRKVKPKEKNGD